MVLETNELKYRVILHVQNWYPLDQLVHLEVLCQHTVPRYLGMNGLESSAVVLMHESS